MVKVLSVNGKIPLVDGKAISATGGGGPIVELDTTLTQSGKAADAKAVGDALAGKQGKLIAGENITIAADGKTISATGGGGGGASLTDDDILECLIGTNMLSAVKDADSAILTDETGKIILM